MTQPERKPDRVLAAADHFGQQVPLMRPWITADEIQGVEGVLRSGWISQGQVAAEFEKQIAQLVGAPHAVATNACTTSLHLALQINELSPRAKVIVPSHTCMATINAVILAGGRPVFADIDRRTFNLDPQSVLAVLDEEVQAILVVHQVGLPADLDAINAIAREHDLLVVEDAATAFGAMYRGKYLGGHGNPVAYSFHPRKMITTGEGGMLMLFDADSAARARRLRSAGADVSDLVRHHAKGTIQQTYPEPGYNYRLTDLQAAVGLAQLRKLPEILRTRAEQGAYYNERLRQIDEVLPPYVPDYATSCYSSYCVTVPRATYRSMSFLLETMAEKGISCRRGIQPVHREPYFRERCAKLHLPNTEAVAEQTMFLPIFPGLTPAEQDRVVDALKTAVRLHVVPHAA